MLSPFDYTALLRLSNAQLAYTIPQWEQDAKNASRAGTDFARRHALDCRDRIDAARAILEQRLCGPSQGWHRHRRGQY